VEEPRTGDERSDDVVSALLAGLEAQAQAMDAASDDAAAEDLARAERAQIPLLDRLRAADAIVIDVVDHGPVAGAVIDVGRDVAIIESADGTWAVPAWGMAAVIGAPSTALSAGEIGGRLGLASVARAWARERSVVRVLRRGAAPLDGTIDRVGADHLDLAEHDPGMPRTSEQVRRSVAVPLRSITALRRRS